MIDTAPVPLVSYTGLFAKGVLDAATAFLLSHVPSAHGRVLDFACGTGVISMAMRSRSFGADYALVDNDALAIVAACENVPDSEYYCLPSPKHISGQYDLVVSNPPIHRGQMLDYSIVEPLVDELPRLLRQNGAAYLVTQNTVPVARFAQAKKMAATEVAANKSYRVSRLSL